MYCCCYKNSTDTLPMLLLLLFSLTVMLQFQGKAVMLPDPSCLKKCGDVDIVFPFGVGADCAMEGFNLDCNKTMDGRSNTTYYNNIPVVNISLLHGQVRMKNYISYRCSNHLNGNIIDGSWYLQLSDTPFTFSEHLNVFTVFGVNTLAYMIGSINVVGCLAESWPYNNLSARDWFCNDVGCCQVALTRNMSYYDVDFSERYKAWISINGTNRSTTEDTEYCGYTVLMEAAAFEFRTTYLNTTVFWKENAGRIPVILNWAVGNGTCDIAKNKAASYWVNIVEKLSKRLEGWQGSALSFGGRLTLINSSLSSVPTYCMSMFLLPKTVLKKMDIIRKRFFWQGGSTKKKYHLVKWSKITRPKKFGGLGIKDLRKMSCSLLCKWWWKLEKEEGIWQEIVKKKYKISGSICQLCQKPVNSPVWNDLIKIKELYLKGRVMIIGNGHNTDFWHDPWCGLVCLKDKFKELFEISKEQDKTVAELASVGWRLTFRRWLDERAQTQLRQLRDMLLACALGDEKDNCKWLWEKTGVFSVKSLYLSLFSWERHEPNHKIWKAKLPLKIKIFMWLIHNNAILTKDNMLKRNWNGDPCCFFCCENENIEHIFFECPTAKFIWSLVSWVIGAPCRPNSFTQFWEWVKLYMPAFTKIHFLGLSAVCWAIWKT